MLGFIKKKTMKTLLSVLILIISSSFEDDNSQLKKFIKSQEKIYRIDNNGESFNYDNGINELSLEREEIFLKAKTVHSNKKSNYKKLYARIQLIRLDFATKEDCTQAKDTLLNCFPSLCHQVKKFENSSVKITPSVWILTDKSIVVAITSCEHMDVKWINFKKNFVNSFADDKADIIETECGGLNWTTKEKINNAP
jgi:hypothetical protein